MITRNSLKRDIEVIRSRVACLSDYTEQHNEIHTVIATYLDQLDTKICDLYRELEKLWNFVQKLDSVEHELDSKLKLLECKTEFLDHNKDALEMWIECVRQTQHLYQESQKSEDNFEG